MRVCVCVRAGTAAICPLSRANACSAYTAVFDIFLSAEPRPPRGTAKLCRRRFVSAKTFRERDSGVFARACPSRTDVVVVNYTRPAVGQCGKTNTDADNTRTRRSSRNIFDDRTARANNPGHVIPGHVEKSLFRCVNHNRFRVEVPRAVAGIA